MIIEIALGILLALAILALMPYIIAMGIIAVGIGLVALIVVGVFLAVSAQPVKFLAVAIFAVIGILFYGFGILIHRRWNHITPGVGSLFAFIAAVFAIAGLTIFGEFERYSSHQYPIPIFAIMAGVIGLGCFMTNRKALHDWRERQSNTEPRASSRS